MLVRMQEFLPLVLFGTPNSITINSYLIFFGFQPTPKVIRYGQECVSSVQDIQKKDTKSNSLPDQVYMFENYVVMNVTLLFNNVIIF